MFALVGYSDFRRQCVTFCFPIYFYSVQISFVFYFTVSLCLRLDFRFQIAISVCWLISALDRQQFPASPRASFFPTLFSRSAVFLYTCRHVDLRWSLRVRQWRLKLFRTRPRLNRRPLRLRLGGTSPSWSRKLTVAETNGTNRVFVCRLPRYRYTYIVDVNLITTQIFLILEIEKKQHW